MPDNYNADFPDEELVDEQGEVATQETANKSKMLFSKGFIVSKDPAEANTYKNGQSADGKKWQNFTIFASRQVFDVQGEGPNRTVKPRKDENGKYVYENVNVVVWGQNAKNIAGNFKKGDHISANGKFQSVEYVCKATDKSVIEGKRQVGDLIVTKEFHTKNVLLDTIKNALADAYKAKMAANAQKQQQEQAQVQSNSQSSAHHR